MVQTSYAKYHGNGKGQAAGTGLLGVMLKAADDVARLSKFSTELRKEIGATLDQDLMKLFHYQLPDL